MISFQQAVENFVEPYSNLNANPNNMAGVPDGSTNGYGYGQYYPTPQYFVQSPWPYLSQQSGSQYYVPTPNIQYVQQSNDPSYAPTQNGHMYPPIQAEFEGYLVPVMSQQQQPQKNPSKENLMENQMQPTRDNFDLAFILQSLLPPKVLQIVVTLATFILNAFSMISYIAVFGSAICSVTPICTLVFDVLPPKIQQRLSAEVNSTVNDETTIGNVLHVIENVRNAFDKYEKMEKDFSSIKQSLNKST